MFTRTKLRGVIRRMWNEHLEEHPEDAVGNMIPIEWRNRVVADLFQQETAEVKAEVKEWRDKRCDMVDNEHHMLDVGAVEEDDTIDAEEKERRLKAIAFQT
jgi:hypothetical protein